MEVPWHDYLCCNCSGVVMIVLDKTYGFNSGKLAAPQANAMAAVIKPLMSGQGALGFSMALVQLSHSSSTVARFLL